MYNAQLFSLLSIYLITASVDFSEFGMSEMFSNGVTNNRNVISSFTVDFCAIEYSIISLGINGISLSPSSAKICPAINEIYFSLRRLQRALSSTKYIFRCEDYNVHSHLRTSTSA